VFCGFCGAKQAVEAPVKDADKTVFGYNVDPNQLAPAPEPEPVPENVQPAADFQAGRRTGQEAGPSQPVLEPELVPAPAPEPAPEPVPAPAPAPEPLAATFDQQETAPPEDFSKKLVGGKYSLEQELEHLPVGQVFIARNQETGEEVSLLLVSNTVFPSPLDMERARRELHQLVQTQCPNILQIKEYGKDSDGQLYLVMENRQFKSLGSIVSQNTLGLEDVQKVVAAIGDGLSDAQKLGVIHRDLAPHNVIFDDDMNVILRGFGVAPVIKKQVFGTPAFVSPEQSTGRPVDQRSNIYSLGVMMYYMLTGTPPFVAPDVEEVLRMHQNDASLPPNTCDPDLQLSARAEALIMKALSKNFTSRHLTMRQFLREVAALDATEGSGKAARTNTLFPQMGISGDMPLGPDDSVLDDSETIKYVPDADDSQAPTVMDMSPVPEQPAPMVEPDPMAKTIAMDSPPAMTSPEGSLPDTTDDADIIPAHQPASAPETIPEPEPEPEPAPEPTPEPEPAPEPEPEPAPEPEPEPAPAPAEGKTGKAVGELTTDVALKKPDPEKKKKKKKTAKKAAAPQGGFRETMWFVKGEEESKDRAEPKEEGEEEEEAPPPLEMEMSATELGMKYKDDGSIGAEGAHHLSLRTGKTQQMKAVDIPSGDIPGEKMNADDFISEMNRGKTIMIWALVGLVVAGIAGVILYLTMGGG